MSTEPVGLDGKVTSKVYIAVDSKNRCTYEGECLIGNVIGSKENLCMNCKYREPVDVPFMLNEMYKERISEKSHHFR